MTTSWEGRTALVTGASSGIGRAMARQLAERGCNLVLTARRVERLEAVRGEIGGAVDVQIVPADLADAGGPASLCAAIERAGLAIDVLINNAGIGIAGAFTDTAWERNRMLLQLNVLTPVELAQRLLPGMLARRRGHVLFVGSVVGSLPVPLMANYAASKAYVRSFAEALAHELRDSGVVVTHVAPGSTATGFFETAGYGRRFEPGRVVGTPEAVAAAALDALARGARAIVPGRGNSIAAWGARVLPTSVAMRIAAGIQRARLPRS